MKVSRSEIQYRRVAHYRSLHFRKSPESPCL
uniref:Uncharacterized protein n=1 Tax=Siphoviridae sp. ctqPo10 TaxID=2827948 RepID=A0A8S5SV27_9CAUD|nr:MAG TPA: hypothetical protein [Siphoviridae sp. ctqPo10]DAN25102.1 MAG TPA: hypothetical protein [Caudoviricetes sp.]DAS30628.1 MAG TPA: hypothetical protein [Caudoviricetes sp.]DAZ54946.1 MAG TPA: hypothetical protein [Caudoviricetes sp.]